MTTTPLTSASAPPGRAAEPAPGYVGAFWELAKPGITRLVCITAGIGFVLGVFGQSWSAGALAVCIVGCIAGTALSAAGANALNMWWERDRDARMHRTARRPVPSGTIPAPHALAAGLGFSAAGLATLLLLCGPAPAAVSAATIVSYVLAYTPLKPVTAWATLVGAVPGALPPLIGYSAALSLAGGRAWGWDALADARGWSLFALMFVWQVPHFLAIAWMHREDYQRGGHRVLALLDPRGAATAWCSLLGAAVLLPLTLWPWVLMPDRLGWGYAVVALVTGVAFVAQCALFVRERSRPRARAVFFGSIVHLPILLAAIVVEVALRALA